MFPGLETAMVLPSLFPDHDVPDGLDETVLAELRTDLGAELFLRLAGQALAVAPEELQQLHRAATDTRPAGVASAAHRLSGLLGQFGAIAVQEAAAAVEAQPDDPAARAALAAAVARACAALSDRLAPGAGA
jgi:HPt (histidine-containing phosphotransfer) domain-containing protein